MHIEENSDSPIYVNNVFLRSTCRESLVPLRERRLPRVPAACKPSKALSWKSGTNQGIRVRLRRGGYCQGLRPVSSLNRVVFCRVTPECNV